jgi:hypothetical protein
MTAARIAKSLEKQGAKGIDKVFQRNGTPVAQAKTSFVDAVLL